MLKKPTPPCAYCQDTLAAKVSISNLSTTVTCKDREACEARRDGTPQKGLILLTIEVWADPRSAATVDLVRDHPREFGAWLDNGDGCQVGRVTRTGVPDPRQHSGWDEENEEYWECFLDDTCPFCKGEGCAECKPVKFKTEGRRRPNPRTHP